MKIVAKIVNLDDTRIHGKEEWWLNQPKRLLAHIYWLRRQISPSDNLEAYRKIISQLQEKNPAPMGDFEKHWDFFVE